MGILPWHHKICNFKVTIEIQMGFLWAGYHEAKIIEKVQIIFKPLKGKIVNILLFNSFLLWGIAHERFYYLQDWLCLCLKQIIIKQKIYSYLTTKISNDSDVLCWSKNSKLLIAIAAQISYKAFSAITKKTCSNSTKIIYSKNTCTALRL